MQKIIYRYNVSKRLKIAIKKAKDLHRDYDQDLYNYIVKTRNEKQPINDLKIII